MIDVVGSGLEQGKVDLARLAGRIRDEFPDLAFDRAVLNDDGDDHAVVILDESWVFRFPRSPAAARFAAGERRLLGRLNAVSPLATPVYERVSARGAFAGYRLIRGQPLSEELFASLARPIQERLVDELGGFLACLHALPIGLVRPADGGPGPAHLGSEFAADYLRRREVIATGLAPELLRRVDQFYEMFPRAVDRAPTVLIHGDLSGDHILLAPDGERLAGVIDFTDAAAGDPAFDFTFLWGYGDWAPARAAASYGSGSGAQMVVERSRWWWTRYSVDRLWWALSGVRAYDTKMLRGHIAGSLTSLDF